MISLNLHIHPVVPSPRDASNDLRKRFGYAVEALSLICAEGCMHAVAVEEVREKPIAMKFPCSLAELFSMTPLIQCLSSLPSHHFAKHTVLF